MSRQYLSAYVSGQCQGLKIFCKTSPIWIVASNTYQCPL